MGSLAGHNWAFVFLFPIGIRRLWSSLSLHARSPPPSFRSRPWYLSPDHNLRNADLYALLLALPVAAIANLLVAAPLRAAAAALFWLLLILLPLAPRLPLPDELAFLLAALAFLADLALSPISPSAPALDARARDLSSLPTLVCAAACLALAARPAAIAADVALSLGIAFKGSWALQAGLALFALPPRGCLRAAAGLECELEEDRLRGVALLDLLFAGNAVGIAAACVGIFWAVTRSINRSAEAEAMMAWLMMNPPDLELD
ncbi:uncharacterized protein LOC103711836 [Phoenix dactylifera]|uniref:Uncharacterized protein LOC103711836 n=1 Tax=Phoenix dactylifera TaxID=42345 RepID=A0A8B7CCT8_PHODC|nr:uncharacterized protein LOC103711836 [Phoenix dactylifera]